MEEKERICVTGSAGYLARRVIDRLKNYPKVELILGIDTQYPEITRIEEPTDAQAVIVLKRLNMADPRLCQCFADYRITSVLHLGWWFNPTHRVKEQWKVNVLGSQNVIEACLKSETIKCLFYAGSTTAYGQLDDPGEESLSEEDWLRHAPLRLNATYPYSRQKAHVDLSFQNLHQFVTNNRQDFRVGWMRGAIVAGKNTRNVVTDVAEAFGPVMFRAWRRDPLMQFISEHDMAEVLYRAVMQKWAGPVNVAGTGTIRYSEVIKLLGKKEVALPFWMLYAFCWLGWNIRWGDHGLLRFPPSILHLVTKPWVVKIDAESRLIRKFNFRPQDSSADAILQLKEGLDKRRGKQ